jgi:general secretion pathway protein J
VSVVRPLARRVRSGFTLIEVVVALAVLAMIGVMAWTTMSSTLLARDLLEQEDEVDRAARAAMDRIEREISLAFLTPNTQAIQSYQTVFVGKDDTECDQLWFATKSHRRTRKGARESDQTEITLWCESDPDNRNRNVLLHRESQRIDHEPDKDGAIAPLARNVDRFELRFLDNRTAEWIDEWDSIGAEQAGRLPRAVQVVLVLRVEDPQDEDEVIERTYVSTVFIETAPRLQRSATSSSGAGGPIAPGVGR